MCSFGFPTPVLRFVFVSAQVDCALYGGMPTMSTTPPATFAGDVWKSRTFQGVALGWVFTTRDGVPGYFRDVDSCEHPECLSGQYRDGLGEEARLVGFDLMTQSDLEPNTSC